MTSGNSPHHVVVDGSNIATEGRSLPSLTQLNEAVMSFIDEHPGTAITVVVDATFGHRIDKREVADFEAGISNNELVAPPAGAVGRGDAFVLSIAQKANASILSNDSFQEFHAGYPWLFDEGRLIGGKPVPNVGWVFVDRVPVRGPVSRKATQGAKERGTSKRSTGTRSRGATTSGSPLANEPMPVPKSPPPGRGKQDKVGPATAAPTPSAPRSGEVVNDLMPFLEFVEHHPIGTSVNGIVESYSSHGAYISIGSDVRGYVPLRLMADPPPPSARKVMQIGEAITVVVVSFAASRRSIDCALPDMAARGVSEPQADAAGPTPAAAGEAATRAGAKKAPTKRVAAKKTAAEKAAASKARATKTTPTKATAAKATAAKTTAARTTTAKTTTAKKTTAKTKPAKAATTRTKPAKAATATARARTAATTKASTATSAAAKKSAAAKATAGASSWPSATTELTTAKSRPVKQAPARGARAPRATSDRSAAKQVAPKSSVDGASSATRSKMRTKKAN